ncbi:MAG: peptidyl-prolyl cis-trans isomerase [Candidatus Cloacimonetes bacterium]|nr:peptidyl-prolyl cis-trans isomerase [Candidatus Cloacimonadota bacterium]
MQRKLLLVTVLFIILALGTLWSVEDSKPNPDPKVVLVEFDKGTITKGDLDERIDKIPPNYQSRYKTIDGQKEILDGLILEDVFYRKALDMGVDKKADIVEKTDLATRELYISSYYRQNVKEKINITDKDRQKYYMAHLDEFYEKPNTSILYIQTKDKDNADKAIAELKSGKPWNEVSDNFNTNSYAKNNKGVIKSIRSNGYIPGLNQNEFLDNLIKESKVSDTEIYGPFEQNNEFHIFKVTDRKDGYQKSFEDVSATIDSKVQADIEKDFNKKLVDKLMKKYNVVINKAIADTINLSIIPTAPEILKLNIITSDYPKLNFTVQTLIETFHKLSGQEQAMYLKAMGDDSFFNRFPTQLLYMAEVEEQGKDKFVDDPDRLRQIVRYFVLRDVYATLVADKVEVDDKDIQKFYDENMARYRIPGYRTIRLYKFDDQKKAEAGRKAVLKAMKQKKAEKQEEAIRKVYEKYCANTYDSGTIDKVYTNNVIFGYGKDEAFSKLIYDTELNNTSPVFTAKNGDILCFTVNTAVEDSYRTLDEVKDTIEKSAKQESEKALRDEVKANLMKEYGYKVYTDRLAVKLTVEELFEMADNAIKQRKYNDAIVYYDQIIQAYADGVNDYKAMFMKGFTYSENLKDNEKAIQCYQDFLKKYPSGDLNDSASFMLDQLQNGEVNIDELIEEK